MRKVILYKGTGEEKLGWFHKWNDMSVKNDPYDYALIEFEDGTMEYVRPYSIKFVVQPDTQNPPSIDVNGHGE